MTLFLVNIVLVFVIIQSNCIDLSNGQQPQGTRFRSDYTYMAETKSFYKFHTLSATWVEAKEKCASEGATLFYPEDDAEANLIGLSYWNQTQPQVYWMYLGISDLEAKGVFKTVDGRPIADVYNKWGSSQPDDTDGHEDCVILRRDVTLNDIWCEDKYAFICKKTKSSIQWNKPSDIPDTNGQQPQGTRFRSDYTYMAETKSFYKFHTLSATWVEAKQKCALEGATLFYPEDEAEANLIGLSYWNQTQPHVYWIYLGISDLVAKGVFETIDGRPIADVYNKWGSSQPDNTDGHEDCVILRRDVTLNDIWCEDKYAFICKKTKSSIEWNKPCDIPDNSYTFNEETGKCYKFHLNPMKWQDAHAACTAEQSYLAIINSQSEANQLVKITEAAPKNRVRGPYLSGLVLLGFHDRLHEGWTTVRGMSLEESSYVQWADKQPDGEGDAEQCGAMSFDGLLNDVSCDQKGLFICEHDIDTLGNSLNDRFSTIFTT